MNVELELSQHLDDHAADDEEQEGIDNQMAKKEDEEEEEEEEPPAQARESCFCLLDNDGAPAQQLENDPVKVVPAADDGDHNVFVVVETAGTPEGRGGRSALATITTTTT